MRLLGALTPVPPLADRKVWIDGRLCPAREAALPFLDRGARDGEGLLETLRVYGGRPFAWERHLERLVVSAAELRFPVAPSPSLLEQALREVMAANGLQDGVARITMTRGVPGRRPGRAGVWVEAEPLEARLWRGTRRGAARVVVSKRPFAPGPLGRHKTTSRLAYHLAREEARAARADEALLVDPEGRVLEGAVSNLFVVSGACLATPPLSLGILPGITRTIVLDLCAALRLGAKERIVTVADLEAAGEMFLTSSVQEVVPVSEMAGRMLPGRETGLRIARAYCEAVARELGAGAPDFPGRTGN